MSETQIKEREVIDCKTCEGNCCKYFALQLDTPETPEDYDHLRWYMAHQQVVLFIEKGDWYLQVNTPCRFLKPDHTCGMYEKRPQICRDYGWDENGDAECHGTDKPCDHDEYFASLEELEAYLTRHGLAWASAHPAPGTSGS
jgi:Fe-S-cluster containining protein